MPDEKQIRAAMREHAEDDMNSGFFPASLDRVAAENEKVMCMDLINELRTTQDSAVAICGDNHTPHVVPPCCIEVIDDWTGRLPREFRADTLLQCLYNARDARNRALKKGVVSQFT